MPEKCVGCKYAKNEVYSGKKKPTFTCLFKLLNADDSRWCVKEKSDDD